MAKKTKTKIVVKVSKLVKCDPRLWKNSEMTRGKIYDTYINGHIVRNQYLEDDMSGEDCFEYGQDKIEKDVEVYTYHSFEDYADAGWWMDEQDSILRGDTPEDLIEMAREEGVQPYSRAVQ